MPVILIQVTLLSYFSVFTLLQSIFTKPLGLKELVNMAGHVIFFPSLFPVGLESLCGIFLY